VLAGDPDRLGDGGDRTGRRVDEDVLLDDRVVRLGRRLVDPVAAADLSFGLDREVEEGTQSFRAFFSPFIAFISPGPGTTIDAAIAPGSLVSAYPHA